MILRAKEALTNNVQSQYHSPGLLYTTDECLDIRVSRQNIGRALRFMDTLIKALRARRPEVRGANHTLFIILEEVIRIIFRDSR